MRILINVRFLLCRSSLFLLALGTLCLLGCEHERLAFPDSAINRTWFPAPNGRYGIEIIDDSRRGVQELWFRHRFREGQDGLVDELHGPGSLVWSPDGQWVIINHRDYGFFHDFVVHRVTGNGLVEQPGRVESVQALWDRLHPEPMHRVSFQGVRWSADGDLILVLAVGQVAEGDGPSQLIRQAIWLDPRDGIVQLAEAPAEIWGLSSPFSDR